MRIPFHLTSPVGSTLNWPLSRNKHEGTGTKQRRTGKASKEERDWNEHLCMWREDILHVMGWAAIGAAQDRRAVAGCTKVVCHPNKSLVRWETWGKEPNSLKDLLLLLLLLGSSCHYPHLTLLPSSHVSLLLWPLVILSHFCHVLYAPSAGLLPLVYLLIPLASNSSFPAPFTRIPFYSP